jgi:hypothetical protein
MLHIIMTGTASVGGSTCKSIAPATAEKANPATPDTSAPANTPALRINKGTSSNIILLRMRACGAGSIDPA